MVPSSDQRGVRVGAGKEIAVRVAPRRDGRPHRGAIVNLARVRSLEPVTHGEWTLVLADGAWLRLSRSHRRSLGALLGR